MGNGLNELIDQFLRVLASKLPHEQDQAEADPEIVAAFLEGRLDSKTQEQIEGLMARSSALRRQVFEESRIRAHAEVCPLPMPPSLRKKVLDSRGALLGPALQLIYRAGAGVLDVLKGGSLEQSINMECAVPVRGNSLGTSRRMTVCTVDLPEFDVQIGTFRKSSQSFEVWLGLNPDRLRSRACDCQIWSGDRLLESQPVYESEVLFSDVPPGAYVITFILAGEKAGLIDLVLEDGRS